MSKSQFRILLVVSLLFAIFSGAYEYMWSDPITDKVLDYAIEIEPELEGKRLVFVSVVGGFILLLTVISFVGLMLFRSWARHVYLVCLVVSLGLYPFMGVSVISGFGQLYYDASMVLSGVMLALMYCPPVAQHFETKI